MVDSMFHTFTVIIPMPLFQEWHGELTNDEVNEFYSEMHNEVQEFVVEKIKEEIRKREK